LIHDRISKGDEATLVRLSFPREDLYFQQSSFFQKKTKPKPTTKTTKPQQNSPKIFDWKSGTGHY